MAKFSALIIRRIVFQINLVGCTCVEIFYMDILDITGMSDISTRRSIPPGQPPWHLTILLRQAS